MNEEASMVPTLLGNGVVPTPSERRGQEQIRTNRSFSQRAAKISLSEASVWRR